MKKLLDFKKSRLDIFDSQDVARDEAVSINDIAIIGMAIKIRDTDNLEDFWSYLARGVDCITTIPEARKQDIESILTNMNVDVSGLQYLESAYLDEIDKFDYSIFNLPPREARLMDPNQRLFLETAWTALEDAGYGGSKLRGSNTGVFVGHSTYPGSYRELVSLEPGEELQALPGNLNSIIASRISYLLDFKGPALMVDTACSSSLTALHLACRSLRMNECSQALVGTVKINLFPLDIGVQSEISSSVGRARTFDDSSDGTGRGEGVIALLIKPLNRAIKDGDCIKAVIKGSAVNQDGSSIGITAPNARAQTEVIINAWNDAEIDPGTISFLEAHGTGTKLGDPIEIEGITQAFKKYTDKKQFCAIGAVKTNIGHLDHAAGLASLIKAVLALKYKQLPPLVHFKTPNRHIDFKNSPVYINDRLVEWKTGGFPRRCGISSFGLSGTNVHVILEEAPADAREASPVKMDNMFYILTLSAKSREALRELIRKYGEFLEKEPVPPLKDICYTANTGREHYNYRLALLVKHKQDLKNKLARLAACDFSKEKISNVFFGHFRIVPFNKEVKESSEITEKEIKQKSRLVKRIIDTDQLNEIARLYAAGANVDWENFYNNKKEKYFKISLPTYPFARKRCWLKTQNAQKGKGSLFYQFSIQLPSSKYTREVKFPLLDQCLAESISGEIYTTALSVDKYWLLREHRVGGYFTLVGTAYLELAVEVCQKLYPGAVLELKELVIIAPLIVPETGGNEIQTILQREQDYLRFKVVSREDYNQIHNNAWKEHVSGTIVPLLERPKQTYNIDTLKQACPGIHHVATTEEERRELTKNNLVQTGPQWNNLKTVYAGEDEFLGYFELAERFKDDLEEFFLYPPLVDSALHFAANLTNTPYLPLMYKKVHIYGPTPRCIYSYMKKKPQNGDETLSFDVSLMNASGEVFARFEDYTIKRVHQDIRPPVSGDFYYELGWIPEKLIEKEKNLSPCTVIVLKSDSARAGHLVKKLVESNNRIIEVDYGGEFKKLAPGRYVVNGSEEDFNRLLEELKETNIHRIIHCFTLTDKEELEIQTLEELEETQRKGIFSLFHLTRSLVNQKVPGLEMVLIAENVTGVTGSEKTIIPGNALLFGLAKVVSMEYPHLRCRCIDMDRRTSPGTILAEINSNSELFRIAYREDTRYIEEFRKLNAAGVGHDNIDIKENGVYVITGGLGGIGLELSQYLASKNEVKLVLIDRCDFPGKEPRDELLSTGGHEKLARKIKIIKAIEETGSEVLFYSADVCDLNRMDSIFTRLRETFGRIDGIIHGAGTAGEGFLIHKEEKVFRDVLMPKIYGTWVLDKLTREDPVDFFILCSSVTAIFGNAGQGDYTAANCYLDSFAQQRSKQGRKTTSINWAPWKEVGMAVDYGVNQGGLFKPLLTRQAIDAFAGIMGKRITRVLIGEPNYPLIVSSNMEFPFQVSPWVRREIEVHARRHQPGETQRRPVDRDLDVKLRGREDGNYTAVEIEIARIWAGALEFEEIDIYDNYYNMGGDSINALSIVNRINKKFGTEFTVVDIFNHLTIEEFSRCMEEMGNDPKSLGDEAFPVIKPIKQRSYYPLSSAQERLFILSYFDKKTTGYNLPTVLVMEGAVDKESLKKAFQALIRRHETLRTSFILVDNKPVQVVHDDVDFEFLEAEVRANEIPGFVEKFVRAFDLNKAPLLRVGLLKSSADKFVVMFDVHHIIADAFSCELLIQELIMLYNGEEPPPLQVQYKDYATWQNELLSSGKLGKQRQYWLNQFIGEPPVLNIYSDFPRPKIQSYEGDSVRVTVDEELTARLNDFAHKNEFTLYMILLAVYYVILYKYSQQEDIVIGSASLGRPQLELERSIGMFINILPIRNYPVGNKSFIDFLAEVKISALKAFENQDYPFDKLVEELDVKRDLRHSPLADMMFSFMSFTKGAQSNSSELGVGLKLSPYEGTIKQSSKFDITLFCTEADNLYFIFEYCTALFKRETIERFVRHFLNIIQYVIENPGSELSAVRFLSEGEADPFLNKYREMEVGKDKVGAIPASFVSPGNEIERELCVIWSKALGEKIENIGVTTGFFQLGGNSIKGLAAIEEINKVFNVNLLITHIFEYPTIKEFSQFLVGLSAQSSALAGTREQEQEQAETTATCSENGADIAVIGMAGRFPGAKHIGEFWQNLENGVETLSFISREELKEESVDPGLVNHPHYVNASGGELENKEYFDAGFFDYTAREAELMDPQIRIFHECVWEGLEDAGCDASRYKGLIGLYAGSDPALPWEARAHLSGIGKKFGEWATAQLTGKDFLASRVSYKLDLTGPAVVIQTACSTSLVAIHMAGRALLNGDCHIALAGGVSVNSSPRQGYIYQDGMILSPDGHCRAFDARAKGTVSGEGVGVVVLKPLQTAISDGDHIYAVIKGSAINNDGIKKVGFPAPGIQGQVSVIRAAQHLAGIKPDSISYVETHGTGTVIGDPIEIKALTKAFNIDRKGTCALGSVKTNVGHLGAAAGVTGFIKTALALKNKLIPPSLHFETPNPAIDFDNSPFYVNTSLKEWKRNGYPRRAGVSSFGIGGTNVHVILEEGPEIPGNQAGPVPNREKLILLSAKTPTALDRNSEKLANYLTNHLGTSLAHVTYTLQVGRRTFPYKRMLVCSTRDEAVEALTSPGLRKVETVFTNGDNPPIIFMFPGQGSQYVKMGWDIYQKEPLYRKEMDRCFEILEPLMGYNPKEVLYPSNPGSTGALADEARDLNQTGIAQPMIFSLQYALAKLLIHWGIAPHAMIGHSIGEYTAALISGVFSLEDALKLVVMRARLMQRMPPGAMLGVPLSEEELRPLIAEHRNICLAAVNSTNRCVVSGTHEGIKAFEKQLQEKGCETRRLHTSHAFHSSMMEPIMDEFTGAISQVRLNRPQIPYISNVSGQWIKEEEVRDPAYWARHLRKTVRFADGISEILKKESSNALFVEIGPGSVVSTFIKQHREYDEKQGRRTINLIRNSREKTVDYCFLLEQMGKLWLYGRSPDWSRFYNGKKPGRVALPTYSFESECYWLEEPPLKQLPEMLLQQSSLKKADMAGWFYIPSWKQSMSPVCKPGPGNATLNWLLFMDDCGVGAGLVEELRQTKANIITVKPGKGGNHSQPAVVFKEDSQTYIIDPEARGAYHELWGELQKVDMLPHMVVHLWGVSRDDTDPEGCDLEQSLTMGFYSLVHIVRAIARQAGNQQIDIKVVTTHVQEVSGEEDLKPEKATILGPLKVIPQEYPFIRCSCIDIAPPEPENNSDKTLIRQLVRELTGEIPGEVIALRGTHRWQQIFEPCPMVPPGEIPSPLREKGVYLITGGCGNIGLLLASYLVERTAAKLVLVGRSPVPPADKWEEWLDTHDVKDKMSVKIRKIQALEKSGGEVLLMSADVADKEQMQQVIARAEQRFGTINGVIHAAGVVSRESSFSSIDALDNRHCRELFHAKIHGLRVLEAILRDKPLDFYWLMSSLSSVLGGLGFTAYSSANIFMDTFALLQNRKSSPCWYSIDWDAWQFEEEEKETQAITPVEGTKAFQYLFSLEESGLSRIIVSTTPLEARIDRWIKMKGKPGKNVIQENERKNIPNRRQRDGLTAGCFAPRNAIEQKIVNIWEDLLGIHPVGIRDDFFELGGDSLIAVQVVARLNQDLKANLGIHILLSQPTIEALAEFIASEQVPVSSLLVEIQAGGTGITPIFAVHPIGGHVYFYHDLAEALGREQPFYGIRARGLDVKEEPLNSIEKMAGTYVEGIRRIQPRGPYWLGGSCFGGIVAFEMAQQLQAQGEEVECLFMADSPGPGHMPPPFKDYAETLAFLLNSGNRKLALTAEQIRQISPENWKKFSNEHGIFTTKNSFEELENEMRHLLHITSEHVKAMSGYRPQVYPGAIVFFRAEKNMPNSPKDPQLAWINLASRGVTVYDVPGNHLTMNYHPNVQAIADVLKKAIDIR